jgi:hypothetical protein
MSTKPLPTIEELDEILAANHRATGKLPYVNDLAAIRAANFARGVESVTGVHPADVVALAEQYAADWRAGRFAGPIDGLLLEAMTAALRAAPAGEIAADLKALRELYVEERSRSLDLETKLAPAGEMVRREDVVRLQGVQSVLERLEWRPGQSFGNVVCPDCSRIRAPDVEPVHLPGCKLGQLVKDVADWLRDLAVLEVRR